MGKEKSKCAESVTVAAKDDSLPDSTMGAYMSEPVTEKHSEEAENDRYRVGSCSMQGWRVSQEVRDAWDTCRECSRI